jgi:hypothetical protein
MIPQTTSKTTVNWNLGWLFLLGGFVWAVFLDPWSLRERDPAVLVHSARMLTRHAQAVVIAMGFLQLIVCILLQSRRPLDRWRQLAAAVLALGAVVYAAGYIGWAVKSPLIVLAPCGAAMNLLGFMVLTLMEVLQPSTLERRAVLVMLCVGMSIDLGMGLFALDPTTFEPPALGPEDGVAQRMLRLARVAAIALSMITLLYGPLLRQTTRSKGLAQLGRWGTLVGTLGMPTILTAAAFVWFDLKYLLPIPALAMTVGVAAGLWLARREAALLEQIGWLLLFVSINFGLTIGLYAFDGPLPAPAFIGEYNDFVRRLTRLGHAYCIVLGLLAIIFSRIRAGALASVLLLAGGALLLSAVVIVSIVQQPTTLLAPGAALVALAMLAGWRWRVPVLTNLARDSGQPPENVRPSAVVQQAKSGTGAVAVADPSAGSEE